ncbi:uncharacterized protein LOC101859479 [Aplysia californica]|uniref:Uncharacterized protein LOC101859479 n=1 Tax=Aplysia californica TaxID=6500 RepID=A0ABM0JMK5_APLCA|nr:uncharacterized protein LOC101859479 [Aplysia californica]
MPTARPPLNHPLQYARERDLSHTSDIAGNRTMTTGHTDQSSLLSSSSSSSSSSSMSSSSSSMSSSSSGLSPLVTSAQKNGTEHSRNSTGVTGAVTKGPAEDGPATGTVVAIIGTVALIVVLLALTYWYLRRSGKLRKGFGFTRVRSRRSSTSDSRRALDEPHDVIMTGTGDALKQRRGRDEAFTIDDVEDEEGGTQVGEEEYYYDEVFGQSPFGDERTNTSVRELVNASEENDEEMLDFDFETLGIKIDDYKLDAPRKFTV